MATCCLVWWWTHCLVVLATQHWPTLPVGQHLPAVASLPREWWTSQARRLCLAWWVDVSLVVTPAQCSGRTVSTCHCWSQTQTIVAGHISTSHNRWLEIRQKKLRTPSIPSITSSTTSLDPAKLKNLNPARKEHFSFPTENKNTADKSWFTLVLTSKWAAYCLVATGKRKPLQ